MARTAASIKRRVHGRIPKGSDLEVHVSTITPPKSDEEFLDIRDYVPSTKTYGRGVVIPYEALDSLISNLRWVGKPDA